MIKKTFLIIAIFASLFLEVSILPFPFVLLLSLLFGFFYDDVMSLVIILFVSVLLDMFMLHDVGVTGLFIFGSFILYLVLEKIFSLQGFIPFAIITYASILTYMFMFGYNLSLIFLLVIGVVLLIMHRFVQKTYKKGGMLA